MTFKNTTRGFTLIELLVVITIIGILATGATAVYTSQIQKARDTTRINDMKALQAGIEQFYQDKTVYPQATNDATVGFAAVETYIPRLPKDPKDGQTCNGASICTYIYATKTDTNGIAFGEYEVSTGLENAGNVASKAANDGGSDALRYEDGLDMANIHTDCTVAAKITPVTMTDISAAAAKCSATSAAAVAGGVGAIFISGN